MVKPDTSDVLPVEEAAAFLKVSSYTIRERARLGEPPGRKVGKEWRFSRLAILNWLAGPSGEKIERPKPDDEAWLDATAADTLDRLRAIEAESPEATRHFLDECARLARPVRWNPNTQELEEVSR